MGVVWSLGFVLDQTNLGEVELLELFVFRGRVSPEH